MDDYLIKTFEGLFVDAEDTILIMSPSQKVQFMNKKAANLFGQINWSPFYLKLNDQSEKFWPYFLESLEENSKDSCVITVQLFSGQYLTIRLHSYYLPKKQLIVSRVTIPSIVQNEKTPFLSIPSMNKMIQNIADGIVVTSLKGEVITANTVALQFLECELWQIENRSHDFLFIEAKQEGHDILSYYRQLANYERATLKVRKKKVDGRICHYHIESRVDIALNVIMTTIIDETEKMALLTKADHQDSLFLIGQNFASIAHELRNPITSLTGFLQLLRDDIPQDFHSFVHIMESELKRMDLMLEEILSLSKPKQIQFHHFCLLEMAREVVDLMQVQAILAHTLIEIEYKKLETYIVYGERTKLKQAVINLVKNAIEATAYRGKITLKLEVLATGKCALTVCDEGIGMTPEAIDKLFQPYYTTKSTGTGLGMMFVKKVIEEHRADMMLCTDVGYGTQIKIVFNLEGNELAYYMEQIDFCQLEQAKLTYN